MYIYGKSFRCKGSVKLRDYKIRPLPWTETWLMLRFKFMLHGALRIGDIWWNFFFFMWTIFKVFIEVVSILLLFYVSVFCPWSMWDLNSPTRDQTHTPCMGRCSRNHWTAREVPSQPFLILSFLIYKMGTCRVPCSEGPCEGEESRCVTVLCTQWALNPWESSVSLLLLLFQGWAFVTIQIAGGQCREIKVCFCFLFFPLGIIRFASSRSSEASGRRETRAELIKELELQ